MYAPKSPKGDFASHNPMIELSFQSLRLIIAEEKQSVKVCDATEADSSTTDAYIKITLRFIN